MGTSPESSRQLNLSSAADSSLTSLLVLLRSAPALLWKADTGLRFTCLAGAALDTLGVRASNHMGKGIEDLFARTPDSGKALNAHKTALRGQVASFETEIAGRDVLATVKPLRGPDNEIVAVVGIAQDVTTRMVAERALRFSEHSYRSLIEEAPYAVCRCTLGGELLQVNRAMAAMLGYEGAASSELLLRDLQQIFTPAGSFENFRRDLLDRGSEPGRDGLWLRRDGQTIQVWVSASLVSQAQGEISHLDLFAENVTEKKRLEAELAQAQRMQALGQLAGGVAHDFNNLLTVIGGYVEMMLSLPLAEDSRRPLTAVKDAAQKAADLTKQMLAFSRRQVLHSQTVNLNDVLHHLMGILSRLIKANIELVLKPADDLGFVKADPGEIERVILNLVVNAQDAMPSGGRLTIETANAAAGDIIGLEAGGCPLGDFVQLIVRDTGIGMDAETKARAFEPFFTTKQPTEGTGLGLSVVYGVVRQSGGYIRIESEPGLGATFRIFLPRVAAAPAPAPHAAPSAGPLPLGSETILLAEDDAGIRELLGKFLESLGYTVLSMPDGSEAAALAQTYKGEIHLLLTDFVMPKVGGLELAAKLKNQNRDLKVLFISGYTGHTITAKDLQMDGVSFLQKPFSMTLLANTVRAVLDGNSP